MKRIATVVLSSLLAASCGGGKGTQSPQPQPEGAAPLPSLTTQEVEGWMVVQTHELDTDRTRGRSKTIEWVPISTTRGTRYHGGEVAVDRVIRNDAEDLYGIEVRVANTTDKPINIEWRIHFMSEDGLRILGLREDYEKVGLPPFGLRTLADSARMRGAVGFELRVRAAGSTGEGKPDAGN